MTNKATPTLAQVMGTLDEMVTAARAGDAERYRAAPARGPAPRPRRGADDRRLPVGTPRPRTGLPFDWHGNEK